jgi:hypothetical protein
MIHILAALLLLIFAPAAVAQPVTVPPVPPPAENEPDPRMSDERVIADFVIVALGREYAADQARTGRLVRWTRPIRVAGMGPRPDIWGRTLEWHMRRLARITRHPIELHPSGEVDLLAIFVPRLTAEAVAAHADVYRRVFSDEIRYEAQMARIAAGSLNAVCFTSVRVDRDFSISAAVAFIPLDRGAAVVRQCIIEEMSQALGLPNDSDDVDPSIFNDHSPYIELTQKDILLLRMLYHPAMRLGMTAEQVRRVGPRVLTDLRRRPYRD